MDAVLNHYGVYGKENKDPFKNDDYVNGIRISYEKTNNGNANGASNFNDIVAVMAVLYEQKMDTIDIDELTDLLFFGKKMNEENNDNEEKKKS